MTPDIKPTNELNSERPEVEVAIPHSNESEKVTPQHELGGVDLPAIPESQLENNPLPDGVPVFKEPEVGKSVPKNASELPEGSDLVGDLTGKVLASEKDVEDLLDTDPQAVMAAVIARLSEPEDKTG